MSTIPFTLDYDAQTRSTIAHLATLPGRIMPAIGRGLRRGAILAAGHIQMKRLSGPSSVEGGRLGIRSHRLINSLRASESVSPVTVTSDTAEVSIGTNVRGYPRAHEFGFNGQVHVPQFTRHYRGGDAYVKVPRTSAKTGKSRKALVQVRSGLSVVKSHTRWLSIPARHWLGGGLADEVTTFNTEIRAEVQGEILGRMQA